MSRLTKKTVISRREFLLAGAALGSAGLMHGCSPAEGAREKYPWVGANQVKLKANGKSVVIIGAGLSGLIAGCELIDRGFKVTILEKNATPGGRLRAWREKNFGTASQDPRWLGHPIEHGTHIVLSFYNNFREFLGRHGLTARPGNINEPASGLAFAYADGSFSQIPVSTAPAPWHMAALQAGFDARFSDNEMQKMGIRQALASMAFDPANPEEVAYLDSLSVADWAKAVGAPEGFLRDYMDPLWDMGNFHPAERTSALYFHRFFGSGLGNWRDIHFVQFFRDSTDESIIQPLKQYIIEHGGDVFFSQEVERFVTDGGNRISGVLTKTIDGQWICPVCGEVHDGPPGRCKRCSYDGTNFKPVYSVGRRVEGDYFFLAVDIPGAKKLFREEPFSGHEFFAPPAKLPTSSIVVVYLWYPRAPAQPGVKANWRDHFGDKECYMTGGFPYLGTTLNLSMAKRDSFGEFDADIIESQVARTEWTKGLSDWEIAMKIHGDLKALIPGLPDFLDQVVMKWDNFSTMTVGAEKNRPAMITPFSNFLLLGDWTALEHNCFLMEKCTVNAKRAVNYVLDDIGQKDGQLAILPSETPSLLVDAIRKFHTVKA